MAIPLPRKPRSRLAPFWRYDEPMPSIQVKNVPAEVHEALQRQARGQRRSLQEFLLLELERIADRTTLDEILDRAQGRKTNVSNEEVVRIIREDRDSH